jgi:mitochondrial fission protein ELM1
VRDERLDHLPHPRIALLVGGGRENALRGPELSPALAHRLGQHVAALARRCGGAVLATTSRRTGAEATEALAAGLRQAVHVIYRWGEPGENPYRGFLACADAVVVTADSVAMLCEACATAAPVFVALPDLAGPRQARLVGMLARARHVRPLGRELTAWTRMPLDETGRVAAEIRRRVALD